MESIKEIGHLPLEALIGAIINNYSSLPKIKLVQVATTSNHYYDDEASAPGAEEMLRSLLELDGDSDPAIRIGIHSTSGSTKLNKGELSTEQLLRSVIGKTSDGKPYLRVALDTL